uniref:F-box domain-containing protein n=1 Tax=Meloidogyne enterolobii TaxID=390850 RepID=A0A6V7TJ27_MELEN|nr:unnamed protein product [Meloidogyne enterolobii]
MYSLPTEAKLDVLKCLNFNQLTSFKLTNFYFLNLIKKYEGELCFRMKFKKLSINVNLQELDSYKIIEPKPGFVKYILNDKRKKWKAPIVPRHRSFPLLLFDIFSENDGNSLNSVVCIERTFDNLLDNEARYYILKLPIFPRSFEELAIIRYCLGQLFTNSVFEYALFDEAVFNPELINLLFNDDKTISPKFHIQKPNLFPKRFVSFNNILKFVSNHLTISDCLTINFGNNGLYWTDNSNLLDIITMKGYDLPKILLRNLKLEWLYYDIVKHITKSKDCSQMVSNISLQFSWPLKFELSERAENVEIKQLNGVKYTKYQIANIHNPKIRFSFCNEEGKDGSVLSVKIKKMKV